MGDFRFIEITWRTNANFNSSTLMSFLLDLIVDTFLHPRITKQVIGRAVLDSVWAKQ